MTARSSKRPYLSRVAGDQSGAIIVFVVVAMAVMMGATGLAVDLGRAYVERVRLGRAIDAAALSAARSYRLGQGAATAEYQAVARANGIVDGVDGVNTNIAFGVNALGENTVTLTATKPLSTVFMRFLGQTEVDIGVGATAAVPPIDIALVLDQSGSLGTANSFDDLQAAATTFVDYFSESIDQMSLVSFQVRANTWVPLQGSFGNAVKNQIALLNSAGYTNMGEGLRLAGIELTGAATREKASKVVVFFTDGRPTAFRSNLGWPGNQQDRIGSFSQVPNGQIRGYNNNPDALPMTGTVGVNGCSGVGSCFGISEPAWRQMASDIASAEADLLRSQGIIVYTIGLGDPAMPNWWQPDLNYLSSLANVGGMTNPSQPQGQMFFAPSAAELQGVFEQVANSLLVRLAS